MTRILFATSNGTGLGHLTRATAIARRLDPAIETLVFTLSEAAGVIAGEGLAVEYHPSYRRPGSGSDWGWNRRLRARLELLLDEAEPDLIVFDGVHPYRALSHVLTRRRGAPPAVWCRRPMWRADAKTASLRRAAAFAAVLEPGELAASVDRGATVARRRSAYRVGPIVHLRRDELLRRQVAEAELGLEVGGGPTALVSLGQGGELDQAIATVLRRLVAVPGLRVVALQSSLSGQLQVPAEVVHLRATFPVSRYYRAFDLAVAAPGYNAFHELLAFAVPTLFVPMARQTDDQAARARWAESEGLAVASDGPTDPALARRLERLTDPAGRAAIRAALERLPEPSGAAEAAEWLARLAAGERADPSTRRRGAFYRWWNLSSHPIGPSLPLSLGQAARDLLAHPERRAPRALVIAFGLAADGFAGQLADAVKQLGAEPSRTLVISDSRDFAALRQLGVGFERVPGRNEYAGPDWSAFVTRRIGLLLRSRQPRRGVVIGGLEGDEIATLASYGGVLAKLERPVAS